MYQKLLATTRNILAAAVVVATAIENAAERVRVIATALHVKALKAYDAAVWAAEQKAWEARKSAQSVVTNALALAAEEDRRWRSVNNEAYTTAAAISAEIRQVSGQ